MFFMQWGKFNRPHWFLSMIAIPFLCYGVYLERGLSATMFVIATCLFAVAVISHFNNQLKE